MVVVTRRTVVAELMTDRVFSVRPDDDLATVWATMNERDVRHVPVLDVDGELVGLVSHRDLVRAALVEQGDLPSFLEQELLARIRVGDVMVRAVETVDPETELAEAARIMLENKYGCLPVIEGGRLVGILTEADFVRFVAVVLPEL